MNDLPGSTHPEEVAVSVVIPTADRAELLVRALRSVLAQTYGGYEILVVRDGPDSTTEAAVQAVASDRIRLIALEQRAGGSEARNIGIRAARGRWIALLDDDDEWLPEKLALQVELAAAEPDSSYVVTTQYLYRRPGHRPDVWPGHLPGSTEPLSEFLFSSRGGFQTSTYLVPRELFARHLFRPGLRKHQDWDWFLRAAEEPGFRVRWVDRPLSIYWAAGRKKSGVSNSLDWRFSSAWARENRSRMTARAYSMFLVRICARGAREGGATWGEIRGLWREFHRQGRPDLRLYGEFLAAFCMPEPVRRLLSGARNALARRVRRGQAALEGPAKGAGA